MEEEKGFLARWSKRKREAACDPAIPPAGANPPEAAGPQAGVSSPERASAVKESEDAAFDLASLPDVDTLTAESDIRDFLRKGVPEPLKNAALRQVWAADPFLRTFTGPGEYAWDFNDPDSIPGFSSALPDFDLAEHARMVTGHAPATPPIPDRQAGLAEAQTEDLQLQAAAQEKQAVPESVENETIEHIEAETDIRSERAGEARDVAAQPGDASDDRASAPEIPDVPQHLGARRRHGGAVPG